MLFIALNSINYGIIGYFCTPQKASGGMYIV